MWTGLIWLKQDTVRVLGDAPKVEEMGFGLVDLIACQHRSVLFTLPQTLVFPKVTVAR